MNWISVLVFLVSFTAAPVLADGPDDEYIRIFGIIEKADTLGQAGQAEPAQAKYQEAQIALLKLRRDYPNWNVKAVAYRLNYVGDKLAALTKPNVEPKAGAPAASSPVKLLEAGAEPRKVLRIQVKAGEKQTVDITAKMSMGMGASGSSVQMMKLPAMKVAVSAAPKSTSASGDIEYEMVVEEVGVDEAAGVPKEAVEAMKSSVAVMKGLGITCTLSDRGANKKAEAKIPANATAEMRESINQLKEQVMSTEFMLPEEAVGPGARWEFKEKARSEGMTMDQTTTLQLVSIDGDILTIKGSTVQSAANQKIPNPVMPQMKADLVKMSGMHSTDMTIDLTKILPARATSQDHTEMTMKMDAGGQRQTMTVKNDTSTLVETR